MGTREHYLDNLCGILILHMIFIVHVSNGVGYRTEFMRFLSSSLGFFMSWFFYKAGMFYKDTDTSLFIKKSFGRLIVPYLLFILIGLCIDAVFSIRESNFTLLSFCRSEIMCLLRNSILWPTAASWFLLALFVVRISFHFLHKHHIHPLLIAMVSILLAYGIFLLQQVNWAFSVQIANLQLSIEIPFYMGTIFHGLFLYGLGYYLQKKQFGTVILLFALIIYVLHFYFPISSDFRANEPGGAYWLFVVSGLAGSILFNNIFSRLLSMRIPHLTYIGENSMVYFLVHFPVLYVMSRLLCGTFYSTLCPFLRFILMSGIITIFLLISDWLFKKKYMRVFVGNMK